MRVNSAQQLFQMPSGLNQVGVKDNRGRQELNFRESTRKSPPTQSNNIHSVKVVALTDRVEKALFNPQLLETFIGLDVDGIEKKLGQGKFSIGTGTLINDKGSVLTDEHVAGSGQTVNFFVDDQGKIVGVSTNFASGNREEDLAVTSPIVSVGDLGKSTSVSNDAQVPSNLDVLDNFSGAEFTPGVSINALSGDAKGNIQAKDPTNTLKEGSSGSVGRNPLTGEAEVILQTGNGRGGLGFKELSGEKRLIDDLTTDSQTKATSVEAQWHQQMQNARKNPVAQLNMYLAYTNSHIGELAPSSYRRQQISA